MDKKNAWLSRTELLVGIEPLAKLANSHVLIIGMGGVGSYAAEFVCRSGIGKITIVDGDTIDNTNRNRQLPALGSNIGESKVKVMGERLLAINPELQLNVVNEFITPEKVDELIALSPDYIIDAIDSLKPKMTFIKKALANNIPFVSSMGAGGKLDPTMLKVADISKTIQCPFAQYIRKKLRKEGIKKGLKVVFSPEKVIKESVMHVDGTAYKKSAYGTISYLPATFGAVCASVAIRDLASIK